MGSRKLVTFSPGRIILLSFFGIISLGTLLLALPAARTEWIPLLDLFFTATSVTCVTGAFTVPLAKFTFFGHCVLLGLMQVGGIGLITLSIFLLSLFVDLGLATTFMAVQLLEVETWKNIRRFIVSVVIVTLIAELLGAIAIFSAIKADLPRGQAIFVAIFQSVSAFCNAGISLLDQGMQHYSNNYTILGTTGLLMLVGGLGFIAWNELMHYLGSLFTKKRFAFSLHSKIILYSTVILLSISTALIFVLEYGKSFANMSLPASGAHALFQAISFRSTGFLTVPVDQLHLATILFIMIIGFIGSSPGSTGSGIKLTVFVIFLATIRTVVTGRSSVHIRGRRIATDQAFKAVTIVALGLMWIVLTIFCLLITESHFSFMNVVFETVSAFTTLGLSTKTATLSSLGKILIILSMIVGRIGSLTLVLALKRKPKEPTGFSYPEERVMLS